MHREEYLHAYKGKITITGAGADAAPRQIKKLLQVKEMITQLVVC